MLRKYCVLSKGTKVKVEYIPSKLAIIGNIYNGWKVEVVGVCDFDEDNLRVHAG